MKCCNDDFNENQWKFKGLPKWALQGENQGITQEEEKTAKVVLEKLEEKQAMKSKIHILISG